MRKLLLLSALVLIAASAFAQAAAPAAAPTMAFTGALYTGTIAQSINGSTPSLGIWDPVNQTGSRFNWQGTVKADTWGLNFRLREDDNWDQLSTNVKITGATPSSVSIPSAPTFRRLYGWMEPVPGVVRVVVGRLSGYEWATGDAGGFSTLGNLDGAVGAQLQIKPIDGLNFGAFLPFTYGNSGALLSSVSLNEALNFMAFGAKYTLQGVGDIEGGYWLAADMPSGGNNTQNTGSSNFYSYPKAWFGFEYVGTQNLVALLESQFAISRNPHVNYAYLDEQVSYQMDQLGLTLYAEQLLWASAAAGGTNLGFRPVVDYTIGNVDVGAYGELVYSNNPLAAGNWGYAFGPFVKVTVAKNVYMRLQPEYGGGDVTPPINGAPLQDYPGDNGSPPYQAANGLTQGWAPLAHSYWQVFLNFVVSF
ncbi:MAG: hypothetical protein ACHQ1F_01635 [Spirochaetia bacterium]